jgi:hypothetical protein
MTGPNRIINISGKHIKMSAASALSTPLVLNTIAQHSTTMSMRRLATTSKPFARAAVRSLDDTMRKIRALQAQGVELRREFLAAKAEFVHIVNVIKSTYAAFDGALGGFDLLFSVRIAYAKMILIFAAQPQGELVRLTERYINLREAKEDKYPNGPNGIVDHILRHDTTDDWNRRVDAEMSQIRSRWLTLIDLPGLQNIPMQTLSPEFFNLLKSANPELRWQAHIYATTYPDQIRRWNVGRRKLKSLERQIKRTTLNLKRLVKRAGDSRLPPVQHMRPNLYEIPATFAALGLSRANLNALPPAYARRRSCLIAAYE